MPRYQKPQPIKFNIPRDAAATLSASVQTVKAILARRAALDNEGRAHETLVVLAGESHNMPAHNVLHMRVIDDLRRAGESIAVGIESAHNIAQRYAASLTRLPYMDRLNEPMLESDPQGTLALKARHAFYKGQYADVSNAALREYLLAHDIPTRFTDAVTSGSYKLDYTDSSTMAEIEKYRGTAEKPEGIESNSREGMAIRNAHMTKVSRDFIATHQPRILYHQCGAYHAVGFEDAHNHYPAAESLAACFRDAGNPVYAFAMMNRPGDEASLDNGHGFGPDEFQQVKTLPVLSAIYDADHNRTLPDEPTDIFTTGAEAAYTNRLLAAVGLGAYRLSAADYKNLEETYAQEVDAAFRERRADLIRPLLRGGLKPRAL